MYIKRHAEETLNNMSDMFRAILVTGARQVGKTTLLTNTKPKYNYVTLDDVAELESAKDDAKLFLKNNRPPVIIDEIQYAPSIFSEIKIIVDSDNIKGQFLMSGSQQFSLMENVTESLAGRLGILNLPGLSLREVNRITISDAFTPKDDYLQSRAEDTPIIGYEDIWNYIARGSMPELYMNNDMDKNAYYAAYTSAYIERDVRALTQVGNTVQFAVFMRVLAARTGQMLNLTAVANEVDISVSTAKRWLSILQASNIVFLLEPFYSNQTKRLIKTPKLYFTDTGLVSYLTRWPDAQVMRNGAMAGAFFETFVVNEIVKSYLNKGIEPPIYYYRDKDGKEIDLLLWEGNMLYPIEIKMHSNITAKDTSNFAVLDKLKDYRRMPGCVIGFTDKLRYVTDIDYAVPAGYI